MSTEHPRPASARRPSPRAGRSCEDPLRHEQGRHAARSRWRPHARQL